MQRVQEKYARLLYDKLVSNIGCAFPGSEVIVNGQGVNWKCSVSHAKQACVVHCFEHRGPEYLTVFQRDGLEIATARTDSAEATVDAIRCWLHDEELTRLYDRFPFVDQRKRELIRIRETVVAGVLGLQDRSELRYSGSGIYQLWFRSEARSALIYF